MTPRENKCLAIVCWSFAFPLASAAAPPPHAVENIERMAGCFEVTYRFAEDGERDMFSPSYSLTDPLTEWIQLSHDESAALVLNHVAVAENRVVSHFRERWSYSDEDGLWHHQVLGRGEAEEQQGNVRYACNTAWEGNMWQCRAGRAEKPLRDSDAPYEWLDRDNTLIVTPRGWIHNERNRKMDGERVVALELGWITYRRIDESSCQPAADRFPFR